MPERRLSVRWRKALLLLPLAGCALIYSQIHHLIGRAGFPVIHDTLIAVDRAVFGGHPVVWWREHGSPILTDLLSFCYLGYNLVVGVVAITAVWRRPVREARLVIGALTATYLCGYALYVLLPAAPPHAVLAADPGAGPAGGWVTALQNHATEANPNAARGAFPSLHVAVTLVAVLAARRLSRKLFAAVLPPALGLVPAVLLLGHHYAADVLAGLALGAGFGRLCERLPKTQHDRADG